MATRFYLPDGGTAAYSPTPSSTWDITSGWTAFPTDVTKSNTALGAGAPRQKGSTVSNDDRLDRIYVSAQQLAAQTISAGTFSAVIRAVESNAAADYWLNIIIRCVNSDGTVERGVIYAGTTATAEVATAGADAQEYSTTSSTRIKSALTTSSVVAQAGDRIQIEVGVRGNGTTSTHTFTHRYGDATGTADFALTDSLTTDLCPWVELSQTLTFGSPAAVRVPARQFTTFLPAVVRASRW